MKKLVVIIGARPNFMKVARFKKVAAEHGGWQVVLVHTGQHLDDRMSTIFSSNWVWFPDHSLGIHANTANARVASMMLALEPVLPGATGPDDGGRRCGQHFGSGAYGK
ncbi:MAG: hypothetical protein IPI00_01880 [Flavobacteriales bacterium]|nr:hypothetical protein [Flavobacteriales bacterium]